MNSTRRQLLSMAVEVAVVFGGHCLLWLWIADQEIAARLLAAGDHLPRLELAAAAVFVVVRFIALFLLPGVVLARLVCLAWDVWGPKAGTLDDKDGPRERVAGPGVQGMTP